MAVVLFFTISAIVIILGSIVVGVAVHHHWKEFLSANKEQVK